MTIRCFIPSHLYKSINSFIFDFCSGWFLISLSWCVSVKAYWNNLLLIFFGFTVAFLHSNQLGDLIYDDLFGSFTAVYLIVNLLKWSKLNPLSCIFLYKFSYLFRTNLKISSMKSWVLISSIITPKTIQINFSFSITL